MSGRYLLDTNVVIAFLAGQRAVQDNLANAGEVFVPSIAIGEMCFGARKSTRVAENLARIEAFVAANVILACDVLTAHQYGAIKNTLRLKGRPLPENDIWIAAIAVQHGLTLVTSDRHFAEIEGLSAVKW